MGIIVFEVRCTTGYIKKLEIVCSVWTIRLCIQIMHVWESSLFSSLILESIVIASSLDLNVKWIVHCSIVISCISGVGVGILDKKYSVLNWTQWDDQKFRMWLVEMETWLVDKVCKFWKSGVEDYGRKYSKLDLLPTWSTLYLVYILKILNFNKKNHNPIQFTRKIQVWTQMGTCGDKIPDTTDCDYRNVFCCPETWVEFSYTISYSRFN